MGPRWGRGGVWGLVARERRQRGLSDRKGTSARLSSGWIGWEIDGHYELAVGFSFC